MVSKRLIAYLFKLWIVVIALPVNGGALIDPTRPTTVPLPNLTARTALLPPSWKLESTLIAPDRKVAVINGRLVTEGELIDGARVISIRKNSVLVKTTTESFTLQLLPDIVRKKP